MVVIFHSSPKWFRGGFIGVDVFFVISGYLITGLLVREIEETDRLSLAAFYARRIRRLLPASALVLLATIMACTLLLSPLQQYRLGTSGSHTALYISNFWFLRQSSDYFAPAVGSNPFLHTWSLAVEEQFYLVWPAIILLGLRGRRPRRTLFAIMLLITAGSLAASVWFSGTNGPWAFFSPFSRAWEFAAGGIALLLARQGLQISRSVRALAGWLGLVSILAAGALLRGQAGWPGWLAVIPVAGTAAVLLSHVPDGGASKILEFPVSQWLGRLSYSWYLWHWPLLAVLVAMHPETTRIQRLGDVLLCVTGSLGLAAATHAIVENPIRFSGYLARRRALTLVGAGLVTTITAGTATAWQHFTSVEHAKILGAAQDARNISTCPPVGFEGSEVVECAGGNPASKFAVVLFGDSHADQWFPAFEAIANNRGWRLILIRKPACPTARVASFNVFLNKPYTECDAWREAAIQRILEMHPSAVVIANRQMQSFSPGPKGPNDTWREGSRKTLETLDSAGIKTILLRDTPSPGLDIPDCLAGDSSWWARRHAHGNSPCTLNRAKALDPGVFGAEQEAVAGLPHVRMLDLSDLFCDAIVCQPVKNGLIVYSDDSHISEPFARSLASAAADQLVPLISSIR